MKSGSQWVTAGGVVQGATHIRQDKICQDALFIYPAEGNNFALACIADGHGSARCPYSDEGAAAAVKITAEILIGLLEGNDAKNTLTAQKDIRLPKLIENEWKNAVQKIHEKKADDWAKNDSETPTIPTNEETTENVNAFPAFSYELYGSTLLALVAAPDFVFAVQIGDGDIVAINPDGLARWLLPPGDASLPGGNETESLCMDDSWKYIRTQLIPIDGTNPDNEPLMLMLSTDGYANSFVNSAGFLKAGSDIYRLWRENGRDYINQNLPGWLNQTSADGSGDDIAVAIIVREE